MKKLVLRLFGSMLSCKLVVEAVNWYLNFDWYFYRPVIKKRKDYLGYHILKADEGNDSIAQLLGSGEPAAIAKLGNIEAGALMSFVERRGRNVTWASATRSALYRNAGVFPATDGLIERWCKEFLDSIQSLDLVAVWYHCYESKIVKKFASNAKLAELTSLEPYFHKNPWSRSLKGKRVLVISPFADSIRRQYQYKDKIWNDKGCLPDCELDAMKVPLSDALVKSPYRDWFDAFECMKTEISGKEFDAAIVGAGAYSIPLVAYIKQRGKFAIHLGGSTQFLFGIRGQRWDSIAQYSMFYNEYWISPSKEETPPNASIVEDGCYW